MIIYVDWVDLCWKSTLIRKIEELFSNKFDKIHVFKTDISRLPRQSEWNETMQLKRVDIWKFYHEQINKAIDLLKNNKDQLIILDRFFMSEIVYWNVMRKYDFKELQEVEALYNQLLLKIQIINESFWWFHILYLNDDVDNIMNRFNKVWDDYLSKKEQFIDIMNLFDKEITELKEYKIDVQKINVFKDNSYWWDIIENIYFKNYKYVRER